MGIGGMDDLVLFFHGHCNPQNGPPEQVFLTFSRTIVSPVLLDATRLSAACLYIVFGIHMEALDGYCRNG